eukprot:ANDGO_02033.mRNA.1 UNC93-like protein 3
MADLDHEYGSRPSEASDLLQKKSGGTKSMVAAQDTDSADTCGPFPVPRFNVLLLGFSFMILFSAFNTTQSYMTTLNASLGFISLSVLYGVFSLCVFIAPAVESRLGSRLSIILGGVTYALYVGASIQPDARILIPASVLIGFGASILWTGQGHFITLNSTAANVGTHSGIFWAFFQCNAIIGNVLAASLLESGQSPSVVFTILFIMAGVGVFFMAFFRQPKRVGVFADANAKDLEKPSIKLLLLSVFSLLRTKLFLQLSGLFLFSGFSQGFMFGRFPPIMGKSWIGWVMATLGAAEALGSVAYGKMSDNASIGTRKCLYIASVFWMIALVFVLTIGSWAPASYFFAAIFMGLGDSGFNTQISAILSAIYDGSGRTLKADTATDSDKQNETSAAFAGLKFMQSVSMGIGMALGLVGTPLVFVILVFAFLVLAHILFIFANRSINIDSLRR